MNFVIASPPKAGEAISLLEIASSHNQESDMLLAMTVGV
jgi:hypothetical protein